ncbi:hypothetical protein CTheo_7100 [Ceratobasidium theobromae]|uniref:NACHT domain-containing protein n=1 Tax=Ceratobasidium theobromae TaxID=1582974 RepID=A0A5N5QCG1_9AGAM|nr:hypothetical protein CTheo_7100 [Ceratobasidium theobromae]
MDPPPDSPSPKRSVRSYLRKRYSKFVQSHSNSPSQSDQLGSPEASNSGVHLTISPPPNLAPPATDQLRHTRSDSHIPSSPDPVIQESSRGVKWTGLQTSLEELSKIAGAFPPLKSAIGSLLSVLDLLDAARRNHSEYEVIASEIETLSQSLAQHMKGSSSIRMSNCIANVALGIEEQAKMISEKQDQRTGRRLIEARTDEDELVKHYRKIESLFRQLQTDANLSTWSIANEHLAVCQIEMSNYIPYSFSQNTRLEGLSPAKMANYDSKLSTEISRRACTEGTRTAILTEMNEWSLNPDSPDLYLMSGMAGTGKTTIACSFSNALEKRKQLAASFFCTRTSPECRDASRIVPTIAYQLARYSIPFQSALCEVLGRDPDIGSKNISKQFEELLKEPLLQVKAAIPEDLVVVIDALDECEDRRGVKLILDMIFKFAPGLPLKFFVTSRPEPEIYGKMISPSTTSRTILHLHEIEKSLVQADIELYLKEELESMSLTENEAVQLATRSGNLFIYAATLVRYIQSSEGVVNPQLRLRSALAIASESTSKYAELDALYTAVLKAALQPKGLDSAEVENARVVLWTVLCAQEPISIETLAALAGANDTQQTLSILKPLMSVVHLSEASGLVSTLHASFPDFMFSEERSGPFFCDGSGHNRLLTQRCFELMKEQLRFNICNVESSFVPDEQVEDLETRISEAISPTLGYACRYWADHLQLTSDSNQVCSMLEEFLSIRLLFWMEVLNLKHEIIRGLGTLVTAKRWLQSSILTADLVRLADDAQSFLTTYAANPMSRFTPHIYISSLPLCPRSSLVYKYYWPRTQGLIDFKGSGMDRRETAALATWTIGSSVRSITYSPDGSRVAFGCKDGSIGVRNAYNGAAVISSFKGHDSCVWSVAFSPDGTLFISGSGDRTIKIWNAHDGTLVGDPLQGHTGDIASVAFSFDGRLIASGSSDKTIRVWSANGTLIAGPFEGHGKWVRSVAFSPDNTRIVSGSNDRTIRVWNVQDGTTIIGPLTGHTDTVRSVAFSPDGTHIVSSSTDHTIRIWRADDGTLTTGPLEGHTDLVTSVAYSPDGSLLVSGSLDNTVRVWCSKTGSQFAGPFENHSKVVWSVSFSPDGTRIASSSSDGTICLWNPNAGIIASQQVKGHTDRVWSVAFAHNNTFIASGSFNSIYVWDTQSGNFIAGPFKGHTDTVRSIAISADDTRLISGSNDCTICVWDLKNNGALIAKPLRAHTLAISSVAFSPDATLIASGASDRTVRVHSSTSTCILPPFKGHSGPVTSVGFSPDGTRIVSGSYDRTIRVWNTHNGESAASPFLGHTDLVMSVAFSPCSTYIVSGSKDRTVRVWNIRDGTLAFDPFIGHTSIVKSVSFSPDSSRIVSGSDDCTVRVWGIRNGTLEAGPLYGHASAVASVAFSPDGTHIASSSYDCTIRMWNLSDVQHVPSSPDNHDSAAPNHSPVGPTQLATLSMGWIISKDGWITDQNGHVLFWAPPEVIRCLSIARCSFIISRFGTIEVDTSSALLGERWSGCYISEA